MNRIRRKALRNIIDQLKELKSNIEKLQQEEKEYHDNMPENLQGSERNKLDSHACSNLLDAVYYLENAIISIDAAAERKE